MCDLTVAQRSTTCKCWTFCNTVTSQ